MTTLSSILNKYDFKQISPGQNDANFSFPGPGLCIIASETDNNGKKTYCALEAYEAQEVLEVAKRLLTRYSAEQDQGYVVALLATVSQHKSERLAVLADLTTFCKTFND